MYITFDHLLKWLTWSTHNEAEYDVEANIHTASEVRSNRYWKIGSDYYEGHYAGERGHDENSQLMFLGMLAEYAVAVSQKEYEYELTQRAAQDEA